MAGPLSPYVGGFAEDLVLEGYAEATVAEHVRLVGQVSRWMNDQSLETCDLTPARVEEFAQIRIDRLARRPLDPLLDYLRRTQLVPPPAMPEPTVSALGGLLAAYRQYLLDERGLVETTVRDYERRASVFVSQRTSGGERPFEGLTAAEIHEFVLHQMRAAERRVGQVRDQGITFTAAVCVRGRLDGDGVGDGSTNRGELAG